MAEEKKGKDIIVKSYEMGKPDEMVKMAETLRNYIAKQKLYTEIKGKAYAHVDAWQFAGFLTGLMPRIESVESIGTGAIVKWKAVAHIYKDEKHVSTGIAICSSAESNKKGFDEYAILSMAQTRAIGKAYRNLIGWIIKLAGYESTPTEEMHKVGDTPPEPKTATEPTIEYDGGLVCSNCGKKITKAENDYSTKMYGKPLCRDHQKGAKRK